MAGSRRVHNDKGFRPWLGRTLCGDVDRIRITVDHEMFVYYVPNESGSQVVRDFTENETLDLFERYRAEKAEEATS